MDGLFLEIVLNPFVKSRWFFNSKPNGTEEDKMIDYFEGHVKRYKKKEIEEVVLSKKDGKMIIPRNGPNC